MPAVYKIETIKVDRIFLDHDNPRHETLDTQEDIIAYLCNGEEVLALARDISRYGLNPLELLALLPGKAKNTWTAAEGNRRMCAIKLLNDPDLAPTEIRKKIEKFSANSLLIKEVTVIKFEKRADVQLWLDRIHQGPNGGVGRRQWNADQKSRNSGGRKYSAALKVLDYAQDEGLITADERKKKLTTAQRFLSNRLMREALGIDLFDPDNISINRPEADFKVLLKIFIDDLLKEDSPVTSRKLKADIEAYARGILRTKGISSETTPPEPIAETTAAKGTKKKQKKPRKPALPSALLHDEVIEARLKELGNSKLISLYYSICGINLNSHTPIIAVGFWSFMETLTAKIGSKADFNSYFNKQYLQQSGFGNGKKSSGLREAIQRVSSYGNTTKHDDTAAQFNGSQLANDMETMQKLILFCVEKAIAEK